MSEVVNKLWGFCNTLRHDGIGYGDYIEQLTYLLFLKLAGEKGIKLPKKCDWATLRTKSGTDLLDSYVETLRTLSRQDGILGDIFAGSLSKFREPVNLKKLIGLIDETRWSAIDVDIKADAYEGLLQKYASEQKGAGQYFTPREAIRTIVRCTKPDIRVKKDFAIHDPALGTGGFLIGAYEWTMNQTNEGALLSREDRERLQNHTFSGSELVLETRRLGLMNLFLHEIRADVHYGDSLGQESYASNRYDCVMTNPPFGRKGSGQAPVRDDFTVSTSNKQLNFLQHVMNILKPGGRAAIILPDGVLSEMHAGLEVRKLMLKDCNLHTILRLPTGTFTPYSPGVRANILFFQKGVPTRDVWIYDLRTNVEKVTIRHPLTSDYFADFEKCYSLSQRHETERFKRFSVDQVTRDGYNLDIFWLRSESESDDSRPLDAIVDDSVIRFKAALEAMSQVASIIQTPSESDKETEPMENWEETSLDTAADIIMGQSPPSSTYNKIKKGIPFYQGKSDFGRLFPTPRVWCSIPSKIAESGDILISVRAPVGPTNLCEQRSCIGRGIAAIRPLGGIPSKFILYFLRYKESEIAELGTGSTFTAINRSDLESISVPIPPLAEQRRLVEKIDKLFSYLDQVEQSFGGLKSHANAIRQSILSKAFSGELVSRDSNDEPASILIEHLEELNPSKHAKTKKGIEPRLLAN
jgi:type I restriction enzyme M protein